MTTLFDAYKAILDTLRTCPPGRAREVAIERLEESAFWASATVARVPSPIDYTAESSPAAGPPFGPKAS